MSVVRINAITVPEGRGAELEQRFRARLGEVETMDGFEGFELLRPEEGSTWYVYTRWASTEAFDAWVSSDSFRRGHAEASARPVAHGAELLSFEVAMSAEPTPAAEASS
ncbi:MAG: antibiotic biosynthesis monooxygenase [Actinomycetota bacterium]